MNTTNNFLPGTWVSSFRVYSSFANTLAMPLLCAGISYKYFLCVLTSRIFGNPSEAVGERDLCCKENEDPTLTQQDERSYNIYYLSSLQHSQLDHVQSSLWCSFLTLNMKSIHPRRMKSRTPPNRVFIIFFLKIYTNPNGHIDNQVNAP